MRISSVPYAEEEMQSGASTPSASTLDSRWWSSRLLVNGGPSSRRFSRYPTLSGSSTSGAGAPSPASCESTDASPVVPATAVTGPPGGGHGLP